MTDDKKQVVKPKRPVRAAAATTKPPKKSRDHDRRPSAEQRRAMIAEAAYYRSLEHSEDAPIDNWLAAERMIDCAIWPHR